MKKRKLLYIQLLIYVNEINNDILRSKLLNLIEPENILKDEYIENNTDSIIKEVINKTKIETQGSDNNMLKQKITTIIDNRLLNNLPNYEIFIEKSNNFI